MKTFLFLFVLLLSLKPLSAQTIALSSFALQKEDSTLALSNGDTSYVFSAYVLTQLLNGIDSVKLVCENNPTGQQWTFESDTAYAWSQVTSPALNGETGYAACKPNDNVLKICLGRLYYAGRHRYTVSVSGSNGTFTQTFIF